MPVHNRNPTHTKTIFWVHIKAHTLFRTNVTYTGPRTVSILALGNEAQLLKLILGKTPVVRNFTKAPAQCYLQLIVIQVQTFAKYKAKA